MASRYRQAWLLLKSEKVLSLVISSPRVERTIRKAIIEQKKLDKDKDYLERISVKRSVNSEGKIQLDFSLIPSVRRRESFYDLSVSENNKLDIDLDL